MTFEEFLAIQATNMQAVSEALNQITVAQTHYVAEINKARFPKTKNKLKGELEKIITPCKQIITDAKEALQKLYYDNDKMLATLATDLEKIIAEEGSEEATPKLNQALNSLEKMILAIECFMTNKAPGDYKKAAFTIPLPAKALAKLIAKNNKLPIGILYLSTNCQELTLELVRHAASHPEDAEAIAQSAMFNALMLDEACENILIRYFSEDNPDAISMPANALITNAITMIAIHWNLVITAIHTGVPLPTSRNLLVIDKFRELYNSEQQKRETGLRINTEFLPSVQVSCTSAEQQAPELPCSTSAITAKLEQQVGVGSAKKARTNDSSCTSSDDTPKENHSDADKPQADEQGTNSPVIKLKASNNSLTGKRTPPNKFFTNTYPGRDSKENTVTGPEQAAEPAQRARAYT